VPPAYLHRGRPTIAIGAIAGVLATAAGLAWLAGSRAEPSRVGDARPPSVGAAATDGPADGGASWAAVTWTATIDEPFGPPDPLLRVEGIVAAPDGYLAWGKAPMPGRNQFNDMGAVFLSRDGTAWETVAVAHGVEAPNASTIIEVAAGPTGFLAIGSVCCEPERPAAWHSPDGRAWTRMQIDGLAAPAGTWLQAVAGTPDGWLVLGGGGAGATSAVWFTADGRSWETTLEIENGRNGPSIRDLAATGRGTVAVGFVEGEGGSYDGAVWLSDGDTWERRGIGDPGLTVDETQLWRVVPHAGGFLAVGVHGTGEQRRRCEDALGLAALSPLPPPPPSIDATSCSIGDERVWRSADGDAWTLVDRPDGAQPIEFRVIAAGGPGLVLLGETSAPASPDTVLFASPDGAEWHALVGRPLDQHTAIALAVRGDAVVAITEDWTDVQVVQRVWLGVAR
jgi:hypothetical protein